MIQQKTPKKIKGARKKRRIKEKENQKRAIDDVRKYMRAMVDGEILAMLYEEYNS